MKKKGTSAKKGLAVFITAALVSAMLTGCGGSEEGTLKSPSADREEAPYYENEGEAAEEPADSSSA